MQSRVGHRMIAIVEYFVHPDMRADTDEYHRARILIAVMLALVVLIASAYIAALVTLPLVRSIIYGSLICVPSIFWFGGLLAFMRRKGAFRFCSIATVLAMQAIILTGISVSGGPLVSPVIHLLVLPPLIAHFFGGLKWGKIAAFSTLMLMAFMYAINMNGVDFIQTIDSDDYMRKASMIVSFLNVFAISTMAFIYEITSVQLKNERDTEHEKYIQLAKTDALTGLSNRRNFDALLLERASIYGAQHPPGRFALGYLDLDGFKPINDQYGHAVGDEVLRIVSDRLRHLLRGADLVGRHGGDEFMLLLDSVKDSVALEGMAQRILNAIAQPINTTVGMVSVSGSLGFALFPLDASEVEELKKHADAAMYVAKRQHGCWRLYEKGM